jgi:1-acyl-sn-glycerol-3-phosphate acyltransferase
MAEDMRTTLRAAAVAEPVTDELALGDAPAALPARREDLRDLLPGIESERTINDWGRSEFAELVFDRTLVDFYYHLWFRCEVEGIENVPATGGALLVSNHSGALPPDATCIQKAIAEEHDRPRPLYTTIEHFFKGYPLFNMLMPKIGTVPAHPANVHRLLYDERQLVLVFPEGAKATSKLYRDRYRLRRFGRGGFVEAAMRAQVPIVPIALIGAEEAQPIFAHVRPLQRITRLIYFPLTPTFPIFGPLGMLMYLPAKFKIRFLPPVRTDDMGDTPWEDKALVQSVAHDIRALIQEEVQQMVGARRSVWFG